MNNGSGDLTFALEFDALQRFTDPEQVFSDARRWSEHVGIISDEPTDTVMNFTRRHHIRQDFVSGPWDREESLRNVSEQFVTDRHVFVGTDESDAELAELTGWEYLSVETAAKAADWELGDPETPATRSEADEKRDEWP